MKTVKIGVIVCGVMVCAGAGAQSLLVANQGDATLSVIDAASGKQVAVVEEKTPGVHGHEVVASADGKTAFLPIYGSTRLPTCSAALPRPLAQRFPPSA